MKVIGICGVGGAGREILDLVYRINSNRWNDIVFVDRDDMTNKREYRGRKVYTFSETIAMYGPEEIEYTISVGDVKLRERIFSEIKAANYHLTNLVAPGVNIPNFVSIGEGVTVRDFSYISVDVTIKDNVMIQPNCAIGHDVIINEHSIISANTSLAGGAVVGRSTYIALNCAVKELVTVGSNVIIAMGSAVNRNIPDQTIASGNPAEVIAKNYLGSAFVFNRGGQSE